MALRFQLTVSMFSCQHTIPRAMDPLSFTLKQKNLPLALLLLLPTFPIIFSSPLPNVSSSSPTLGDCDNFHDCTSTENPQLPAHFSRLPSIEACREKCREKPQCQFFTFNYQPADQVYPGACFLFTSCTTRRASEGRWVSGPRDCPASRAAAFPSAKHFRDLQFLLRPT